MGKQSTLTLRLKRKRDICNKEMSIRVSGEMYEILRTYAIESDKSLKEITEILLTFALDCVKVEYE